MDFKNVYLKDYCFTLDLHKSMFFIDMLKNAYEFTLKGDEIEIFKKLNNGISEPITRKELIYSIQVEMAEKYDYSSLRKMSSNEKEHLPDKEKRILTFYHQFQTVDSIYKAIDNMVYLEERLKKQAVTKERMEKMAEQKRVRKHKMRAEREHKMRAERERKKAEEKAKAEARRARSIQQLAEQIRGAKHQ